MNNRNAQYISASPRVEIYKATLSFISSLAMPMLLVFLFVSYKGELDNALGGMKLSKIDTPFGSADFIASALVKAKPGSNEEQQLHQAIEIKEDAVAAAIVQGKQTAIPTEGKPVQLSDDNLSRGADWQPAMAPRWVKPNDIYGRTYYLSLAPGLYLWPLAIEAQSNSVQYRISTSSTDNTQGELVSQSWITVADTQEFDFRGNHYRLRLESIIKAGKIPSDAAVFSLLSHVR